MGSHGCTSPVLGLRCPLVSSGYWSSTATTQWHKTHMKEGLSLAMHGLLQAYSISHKLNLQGGHPGLETAVVMVPTVILVEPPLSSFLLRMHSDHALLPRYKPTGTAP